MPRRIVFVCTGNSCRSPLAEVLARARYAELPLNFASAGTDASPGQPASEEARTVAREWGLDLEPHRSRPVDRAAVAGADWVIALTRTQALVLRQRLSVLWPGRVGLLGVPGCDWRQAALPAPGVGDADPDVADPWRQDLEAYRRTAARIDDLLVAWSDTFRELCAGRDSGY